MVLSLEKLIDVPPSIKNDPEFFKLGPSCKLLKFGYCSNLSLIHSYSKDDNNTSRLMSPSSNSIRSNNSNDNHSSRTIKLFIST